MSRRVELVRVEDALADVDLLEVHDAAHDVSAEKVAKRAARHAYLTTREAARLLRVSRRTVLRRLVEGRLAGLVLTPRVVRVAADAVCPGAPAAVPDDLPRIITVHWLAAHWRVSTAVLRRLAAAGHVPLRRRGRHEAWCMNVRTFRAFAERSTLASRGVLC